jgi:hypothetical protein
LKYAPDEEKRMNDLIAMMCFGALILFALVAFATMSGLSRLLRGGSTNPYNNMGNEVPRFDDPNISSGGSFGGSNAGSSSFNRGGGGEHGHFHDPNIRSGGSFGE